MHSVQVFDGDGIDPNAPKLVGYWLYDSKPDQSYPWLGDGTGWVKTQVESNPFSTREDAERMNKAFKATGLLMYNIVEQWS